MKLTPRQLLIESQIDPLPSKEPALKVGVATSSVAGLLSLIVYLAPNLLTNKQLIIIAVAVAFVAPIITAIFTRGRVWSPESVRVVIDKAVTDALEEVKKNQVIKSLPRNEPLQSPKQFPPDVT